MQVSRAKSRTTASLLVQLITALLLVIVPISIAVGVSNYQNAARLLKSQMRTIFVSWASNHSDSLFNLLVREFSGLRIIARDRGVQEFVLDSNLSPAEISSRAEQWRADGPDGITRLILFNNETSVPLKAYANSSIAELALLVDNTGALLGTSTPNWPAFDLRSFSWWQPSQLSQLRIVTRQSVPGYGDNLTLLLAPVTLPSQSGAGGVLVLGLDTAKLSDNILRLEASDEENLEDLGVDHTWLVDVDGNVLNSYTTSNTPLTTRRVPDIWLQDFRAHAGNHTDEVAVDHNNEPVPTLMAHAQLLGNSATILGAAPEINAAINELGWFVLRSEATATTYGGLEDQLTNAILGTLLSTLVLILVVTTIFRLLFLRPLRRLNQAMARVAEGDFSTRVPAGGSEIGVLGSGFNQMVADVDELVRERERRQQQQAEVSRQLQGSAGELGSSAAQQQEFAALQASSLREIAATFGQLSTAASRIARYGAQVAQVSGTLVGEQGQGRLAVEQSQAVLKRLRSESETLTAIAQRQARSSSAISTIIAEINRIAEETHLLALNATIEASGAGAAGKRFAVIARQVQSLAGQAAAAAENARQSLSEVQGSIERAVEATEREQAAISEGVQQGNTLEAIMQALSHTIEQLDDSARTIAQESRQQQDGSVTANTTVESLAQEGQRLVSYSQAVSQAATELRQLAARLEVSG